MAIARWSDTWDRFLQRQSAWLHEIEADRPIWQMGWAFWQSSLIVIKTCNDCRLALKIFVFQSLLQCHTENEIKCHFAFQHWCLCCVSNLKFFFYFAVKIKKSLNDVRDSRKCVRIIDHLAVVYIISLSKSVGNDFLYIKAYNYFSGIWTMEQKWDYEDDVSKRSRVSGEWGGSEVEEFAQRAIM